MIGTTNVGGGGSVIAFISVTYPAGSTCTCTNGVKTLTAKNTSGTYVFSISDPGTWTVTATDGTNTESQEIVVSEYTAYFVELSFDSIAKLKTYADGISSPVLLSNSAGDYINWSNFKLTRNTAEPLLLVCTDTGNTSYPDGRRCAFVSPTNATPDVTKSAVTVTINDPVAFTTQNGYRLYVIRGGNTNNTAMATELHTDTATKSFAGNVSSYLAYLNISTGAVTAYDSSAEAQEQAAQLNAVLDRFAILVGAESA